MSRNITLYPWFQFFRNLLFWQAIWFLYFQQTLSASEAILLYAVFDVATTALEVPSGYLSDRAGRRLTLCLSAITSLAGMMFIVLGDSFTAFAVAQIFLGAGAAFVSGTDSALLYESLDEAGRVSETERCEILAWRASFTALAFSAILGGWMVGVSDVLPFIASGIAGVITIALAGLLREPAHRAEPERLLEPASSTGARQVLTWIFCLSAMMYVFSHVPFVFGQPFILEALETLNMSADAPLVSGAVTAAMMLVSVAISWLAPSIRSMLGLVPMLLLALALQVVIIGGLAISTDVLAILLLLLRMVPDSLAKPFILARIQPLLSNARRATYLSMQSFAGRMLFAGTLAIFSFDASAEAEMAFGEIQAILLWYAAGGLIVFAGLTVTQQMARSTSR